MKHGQCPKCGSGSILHEVRVLDRNGQYQDMSLCARVDRKPEALLFKGSETVELKAHICAECGYVELYAVSPDALRRASSR